MVSGLKGRCACPARSWSAGSRVKRTYASRSVTRLPANSGWTFPLTTSLILTVASSRTRRSATSVEGSLRTSVVLNCVCTRPLMEISAAPDLKTGPVCCAPSAVTQHSRAEVTANAPARRLVMGLLFLVSSWIVARRTGSRDCRRIPGFGVGAISIV